MTIFLQVTVLDTIVVVNLMILAHSTLEKRQRFIQHLGQYLNDGQDGAKLKCQNLEMIIPYVTRSVLTM